jgi:hypothetical protein
VGRLVHHAAGGGEVAARGVRAEDEEKEVGGDGSRRLDEDACVELLGVREWEGGAIAGGDGGEWRELRAHTRQPQRRATERVEMFLLQNLQVLN